MMFEVLEGKRLKVASALVPYAIWTCVAAGMAAPVLASAQAAPPPSTVSVPTRDELRGVTAPTPEAAPRLSIAGGIERSACPLADPQYRDIKVTISDVMFNNLKGASPQELEAVWKPLTGEAQPIAVLCDIRDAAGTLLRAKGYLAAVQVPTQRIENGQVRMEVLYARVTTIRARGETHGAEHKLQQYLSQLTRDEIFDRNRAERYLLLARDLPGYNVQLTLKPAGTAPGDLIGEVTVLREPVVADLSIQNLASQSTGRWGVQARVQAFGLTGMGDATTLSYYATSDFKEQHILQGSHEFRPGGDGLMLGGQLTYAWTNPDLGAALPVQLHARTLFASLYGKYPVIRSQRRNLYLGAGFDLVNQNVELIGPLTRDRLRVAWARIDFDAVDLARADPAWRVSGNVEVRQGLNILDATRTCIGAGCAATIPTSRFDGSPGATLVRGQAEFERALGGKVAIAFLPRAQYAFKPLLSFEEFSGGNYTVGRGYDPGDIVGDSGVGFSVEMRGPRLRLTKGDGTASGGVRMQPYVFGDAAWAWNKGTPGADRLISIGTGVRGVINERFRLDATVAVPLERAGLQTRKPKPRFLITLTTRLLPWRNH